MPFRRNLERNLDLKAEMLPSEPINEAEVLELEQETLIENGRQLNIQYEPIKEIYTGRIF